MTRLDSSVVTDEVVELTDRAWNRFWAKVEITEDCWLWTAASNPDGYGRFGIGQKLVYPHRLMAVYTFGPIAPGMVVDHLCRTPACCRPDHLEVVTMRQNTERGELPAMVAHLSGKCQRGHSAADHAYLRKSTGGVVYCRECVRERKAIARQVAS